MAARRAKPTTSQALRLPRRQLTALYRRLYKAYGPQDWWPADTPFEVMVGAVLTQNTAWSNVEKAIANLKQRGLLSAQAIVDSAHADLADALRPSGYFNVKAQRLRAFCDWLLRVGGEPVMRNWSTAKLRREVLAVHGIGPETADDIVLYAFDRPVFVIDAYTRRIFARIGLVSGREDYETLRAGFETALGADVPVCKEYHALIVRHAKQACRTRPLCEGCCLAATCAHAAVTAG